ncbi:MAG: hypothetical protein HYZ53_18425, partial [Planctomycetes bacterium]|nr:hypothetical protein [Planctomycetota bacterium]
EQAKGKGTAELGDAVEGFLRALTYKDLRGVLRFAGEASATEASRGQDAFLKALALGPSDGEVEILSARVEDTKVDGDEGTAYVELDLRLRPRQGPTAKPEGGLEELAKRIEKVTSGGDSGKRHLTWYWRRQEGRWVIDLR